MDQKKDDLYNEKQENLLPEDELKEIENKIKHLEEEKKRIEKLKNEKERQEIKTTQQTTELSEQKKKKVLSLKKILLLSLGLFIICGIIAVFVADKKKKEEEKQEHIRQLIQSKPGGQIENLYWSSRAAGKMNWNSAVSYCENLTEDGHSDWRLPDIDELRTTIKNCPKTETGGECSISEKGGCLSQQCLGEREKGSCVCSYKANNSGYYSKLGDPDGVWLWSSTALSDDSNKRWRVGFSTGLVISSEASVSFHVRCVR